MTSHAEFNDKTEALEVAKAFAGRIQGKTALVTGININGVGYATAEGLVSIKSLTGSELFSTED